MQKQTNAVIHFFLMKRSKKQRIGEKIKNKVETNKEQEVEQRIINKYII